MGLFSNKKAYHLTSSIKELCNMYEKNVNIDHRQDNDFEPIEQTCDMDGNEYLNHI